MSERAATSVYTDVGGHLQVMSAQIWDFVIPCPSWMPWIKLLLGHTFPSL